MKKILVTGAYGYIGSHTVKALSQHGYEVTALDNKVTFNDISKYVNKIFIDDITDMNYWYGRYDHVVHLAAAISVEESQFKPWKYINRNIIGTNNALHSTLHDFDNIKITFASTATAFNPVSVYAQTKLLAEKLIKEKAKHFTNIRFFNVAGSDGEFGQTGKPTHLIRIAAEAAAGKRPYIQINGTDWPTYDGTCVRDYIHVNDIVNGIIKSVEQPSNNDYDCLGSGKNYSVRDVIATMKSVTGNDFKVIEGPRREGDAAVITLPDNVVNFYEPAHTLEEMCLSAYEAELRRVG